MMSNEIIWHLAHHPLNMTDGLTDTHTGRTLSFNIVDVATCRVVPPKFNNAILLPY